MFDRVVTAVVVTFVDARAYPLFAALFGYGLVRIAQRQTGRGFGPSQVRALLRRRSWWHIVFGLVHAALGFSGDVLGWYGLLGLLLATATGGRDRTLLVGAAVWLVPASAIQALVYADPRVRVQRDFLWSYAIENPAVAAGWRLVEWVSTPVGLLSVASPMLLGMWAARRGLLESPEHHLPLLRRTAVFGITVGVLGGAAMGLATADVWTPSSLVAFLLSWLHILTGVFCGLGYAAAITLTAHRLRSGRTAPCRAGPRRFRPPDNSRSAATSPNRWSSWRCCRPGPSALAPSWGLAPRRCWPWSHGPARCFSRPAGLARPGPARPRRSPAPAPHLLIAAPASARIAIPM